MLLSFAPLALGCVLSLLLFGLDATLWLVLGSSSLILFAILGVRIYLKQVLPKKRQGVVAFFHPFANDGGGGERVLWRAFLCAIKAIQEMYPKLQVVLYCGEDLDAAALRQNAVDKFDVKILREIQVVRVPHPEWVLGETYPRLTLLGQAVGSVRLAFAALCQLRPEIFIDTSGWAFAFPLVRLAGVKVACYVHYPTISANMLRRVAEQQRLYNNDGPSRSLFATAAKLAYYYAFACAYGIAGACANVVMVNSSWTRGHIRQLWWKLDAPLRVYPPCNTAPLRALPLERKLKQLYLVSLAQFRPEKDHRLQLEAFALARQRALQDPSREAVLAARLKLAGSCRNEGDRARLEALQALVTELGLTRQVDWCVNASYAEVQALLGEAVGGLHTMLDEHFGISCVEYMAAGAVPIAHNSGGPRVDIVTPAGPDKDGWLCTSKEEFAEAITDVLCMPEPARLRIAAAARRKAEQFSDVRFEQEFLQALHPLAYLLEAPGPD